MQVNFIQLLTCILNFVKLTDESVIRLKIILSCHHQLEKARGFYFPTVSAMVGSQIVFEKLSWSQVPCMQGSFLISSIFACSKD